MKKRLISIIVVFAICVSMMPAVFASNDSIRFEYEDLSNGDVCTYMLKNEEVVYSAYVDRQNKTITETEYNNGQVIAQDIREYTPAKQKVEINPRGLFYVGQIKYKQGDHIINVSYSSEYDGYSTYDLVGEYKNLAGLVGVIVAVYSIPTIIASKVAQGVITSLGITGAAYFFVPNYILQAQETRISWYLKDNDDSSRSTIVSGTRYIITEPDHYNETFTVRAFYDPSLFSRKDVNFARDMYKYLYFAGEDKGKVDVVSWITAAYRNL